MLKFVRNHRVTTYYALTFLISWGGTLLVVGRAGMQEPSPTADARFVYALIAMLAGPSISSLVLTTVVAGRAGMRDLAGRVLRWRVAARWYGAALVTAPLIWLAMLLALSFASSDFKPGIVTSTDKALLLLIGSASAIAAGVFEELGWTGFAIPQVRQRHGVFATGVIVGVLWGAWHLLTNVFWAGRMSAGHMPLPLYLTASAIGVLVGYLVAYRVLMVYVYERTKSVLLAMLMHISLTASVLILDPLGITGGALLTYSFVLAGAVWIVAIGVVLLERKRRAQPPRRAVQHAA